MTCRKPGCRCFEPTGRVARAERLRDMLASLPGIPAGSYENPMSRTTVVKKGVTP